MERSRGSQLNACSSRSVRRTAWPPARAWAPRPRSRRPGPGGPDQRGPAGSRRQGTPPGPRGVWASAGSTKNGGVFSDIRCRRIPLGAGTTRGGGGIGFRCLAAGEAAAEEGIDCRDTGGQGREPAVLSAQGRSLRLEATGPEEVLEGDFEGRTHFRFFFVILSCPSPLVKQRCHEPMFQARARLRTLPGPDLGQQQLQVGPEVFGDPLLTRG